MFLGAGTGPGLAWAAFMRLLRLGDSFDMLFDLL
jgi:hypothetical protein